ncbi:hypothetical protein GUITHDRAFT_162674 [Guillardia theta CCMP2712]|uniref:Uncharacterized protein n=1 Tax=Guillardia theta (strain CCMP2712) TaxID=905079 RepID=L1JHX4_GUITC|nr:hypothetical protein GUITHDRAFT_162674 [Guillardia theta CCMP2712]EKX47695.1 hypothetical protein GUITHDRAFT_162674 [Guillardia theta CCMP2712]|eukprot:XP_005834675.1 hypothetical protein GUITHDRAFT_162674 [Guillardia theta CCMP2712]
MKSLQKVNMNKLRSEYVTQMRKRREYEAKEDERRRQIEEEMLSQTAEEPIEESHQAAALEEGRPHQQAARAEHPLEDLMKERPVKEATAEDEIDLKEERM